MNTLWLYLFSLMGIKFLELAVYIGLFAHAFRRRPRLGQRLAAFVVGAVLIFILIADACARVMVATSYNLIVSILLQVIISAVLFALGLGITFLCFEEQPLTILYAIAAAEAAIVVDRALYGIFTNLTGKFSIYVFVLDPVDIWSAVAYAAIHLLTLFLCWRWFARDFNPNGQGFNRILDRYLLIVFLAMLFVVVFLEGNVVMLDTRDQAILLVFGSVELLFGLVILVVERFLLYWLRDWREKEAVETYYDTYKKQVAMTQRNMELVNMKCHDLKHQIRDLLDRQHLDEGFVQEVQEIVSVYDARMETGNRDLDILLTEKSLTCEFDHIQLTAMVDGETLGFMSVSDLNSFFGNALDNAIEYLRKVDDKDNRFIRLSTAHTLGMLTVRVENYCPVPPAFDRAGDPITTKADLENHGFGVRSIRAVVEKYGGAVTFHGEGELFVLCAIFPEQTS